jgi:hypothetical protein
MNELLMMSLEDSTEATFILILANLMVYSWLIFTLIRLASMLRF